MFDNLERLRAQDEHLAQWAAGEIDTLRSELERLRGALLTGASLLEQGCNAEDMATSMRRAAAVPNAKITGG